MVKSSALQGGSDRSNFPWEYRELIKLSLGVGGISQTFCSVEGLSDWSNFLWE